VSSCKQVMRVVECTRREAHVLCVSLSLGRVSNTCARMYSYVRTMHIAHGYSTATGCFTHPCQNLLYSVAVQETLESTHRVET